MSNRQDNLQLEPQPRQKGFLAALERAGNKIPHPALLFIYLTAIIIVLSFILHMTGASAVHPTTGETITVANMLSVDGLRMLLTSFVDNFQAFPILGIVLAFGAVTGVCEGTGLLTTTIKLSVSKLKGNVVVFIFAFICVLSKQASDVCQILMPILGGAIFYGLGRHPLAGIFCAYAASSAGFAASIIPGVMEANLTPITVSSAQLLDPSFNLSLLGSYYGLTVAGILIAIATTFVTVKIIEPRLGTYTGTPDGEDASKDMAVSPEQRRAAKRAGIAVLIFLAAIVIACIPKNSFFRAEDGSLVMGSTLMNSLSVLVLLVFFIPGIVYGRATGQIKKFSDAIDLMSKGVADLAPFVVMAMVIGQFLKFFQLSNIGALTAIKGGELLSKVNLPPQVIIILFLILVAVINILMSSGMTKYLIFGPIFIPMFMQLNIHPAFTQMIYRMGDGITNLITPLDVVFVMLLGTCQKYDKKVGVGTMLTNLMPYSIAYFIVLAVMAVLWMTLGLDVGVGGHVWLH